MKNKLRADAVVPASDSETLRDSLGNVAHALHQLIELAPDEETEELLRRQRRIYFALMEEVIKLEIDQTTLVYRQAMKNLQAATKAGTDAKADMAKIVNAIHKAVAAAKSVDKLVQWGIKHLA